MVEIKSFQDLLVWQKGHVLVLEIYKLTSIFPKNEVYSLLSQMRRAAVSIVSNLVEGFKRRTVTDSLHFYNVAAASLEELRYQLLLAKDLQYLSSEKYENICLLAEEVRKMLYAWSKSQKSNSLGAGS